MKNIILFSIASFLIFSCDDKKEKADEETGDPLWNYEWTGLVVVSSPRFTLPGGDRTTPTTSEASIEITFSDVEFAETSTWSCPSRVYYFRFGERKMLFVDRESPVTFRKGVDFFEGDTGPLWFKVGCSVPSGQTQPSVTINSVKLTSK
jgi:hypothetical protein